MEGRPVALDHRAHPAPEPAFTIAEKPLARFTTSQPTPAGGRLWLQTMAVLGHPGKRPPVSPLRKGTPLARQSAHPRRLAPHPRRRDATPKKQDGGPGAAALSYMLG